MIALVDNRDSFTFNLVQALQRLGAEVAVLDGRSARADAVMGAEGVIVGPGPGEPSAAGCSEEVFRLAAARADAPPILGICLGHQALGSALGAGIRTATELVHGAVRPIHHDGEGLLAGLPSPFPMARYNSLVVDEATLPGELVITARTGDGDIAGLRHTSRPLFGLQGHPESILSLDGGSTVFRNFLDRCGR